MEIYTAGPAFPFVPDGKACESLGIDPSAECSKGMTIRDYIAVVAMGAIISKTPLIDQTGQLGIVVADKVQHNADIADSAYCIADAMILRRETQ